MLDPDDGDESALRLAYMWARWTVRRRLATCEPQGLDLERITGLLEDACRSLSGTPRSSASTRRPRKSIDQAGEQVRDLVGEVRDVLDDLEGELRT